MVKIPFPIGPNALAIIIVDKKVKTAAKNRLEKVMAMFLVKDDIIINSKIKIQKSKVKFIIHNSILLLSTYHTTKIR